MKFIHEKFGELENAESNVRWFVPFDFRDASFDHGDVLVYYLERLEGRIGNAAFGLNLIRNQLDIDPLSQRFHRFPEKTVVEKFAEVFLEC